MVKEIKIFFSNLSKKFKVQISLIGLILEILLFILQYFNRDMAQSVNTMMAYVLAIIVVLIGGHTATDIAYQLKQSRDGFKKSVEDLKKAIDTNKDIIK